MPFWKQLDQSEVKRLYETLVQPDSEGFTQKWNEVIEDLEKCIQEFSALRGDAIPSVDYSDLETIQPGSPLHERIKTAGCAVVRGVVPADKCTTWLHGLAENLEKNTNYPDEHRTNAIARIHWSKPQLEARAYPPIIKTASMMSSLFWSSADNEEVSLGTNITYEDRFRYQPSGMASWKMGAHIDSPGTDCWTRESVRKTYSPILIEGKGGSYKEMNLFDTASKIHAHEEIERGWRSWQASVTLTDGAPGLALFPNLKLGMGYTLLRPFFKAIREKGEIGEESYLKKENWKLKTLDEFMERGKELLKTQVNEDEHPHLSLWNGGMVPVPPQKAGSYMFWHNDLIHSVFPIPSGQGISSVIYIPSAPLCNANAKHLARQRDAFLKSVPGHDMSGDPIVEVGYPLTGDLAYLKTLGEEALRNMGFEKFNESGTEGEIRVKRKTNEMLFSPSQVTV